MTSFGARIVAARKAKQLKQKDIAAHFGISSTSVFQWENDETSPEMSKVYKLAEFLGVELGWLLEGKGSMNSEAGSPKMIPVVLSQPVDYIPIRVANVRPGMGGPGFPFTEEGAETVVKYFDPEIIHTLRAKPEDLLLMQLEGQSMSPFLESGDMVLVDTAKTNPSQSGAFVVWDGFGLVCKWVERVLKADPPTIRLISENKVFQPVELTVGLPEDNAESYIVGRVVWMSRKL